MIKITKEVTKLAATASGCKLCSKINNIDFNGYHEKKNWSHFMNQKSDNHRNKFYFKK